MSPLQPFVDWARAVLSAAEGGHEYVPPATGLAFETTTQPVAPANESPRGAFANEHFMPTEQGLHELIVNIVEMEMAASKTESALFAKKMVKFIQALEQYEHWVKSPLSVSELCGLHIVMHDVLFELAQRNKGLTDVERWTAEDKASADKVLLAVTYVLSWQPYGNAMQFIWTLAKPWFNRLSEVIATHLDNEGLSPLWPALECIKNRVHHFDALMYGFLEGVGSFDESEDRPVTQEDLDAVSMFHEDEQSEDKDNEE